MSRHWPRRLRTTLNLLNLSTPLGLVIARAGGARIRREHGLWVAEGYRLRLPVAGAFTIGDVVTTPTSVHRLSRFQPDVMAHEERHAWQWAMTGPWFLPLYAASSLYSWLRTRDPAVLNFFERDAGLHSGGYLHPEQPVPHWTGSSRLSVRRGAGRSGSRGGAGGGAGGA